MERWGNVFAIFLLGAGTSLLLNASIFKKTPSTQIIEITKEATATAVGRESTESARARRVIDGDTIELSDGWRVRYLGIDTPDLYDPRKPVECFGKEAWLENKKLVEGKEIRMEKDVSQTDKFGRLLRYVYVGDIFVNDTLVRQGFAHASTFPPDVKFAEQFRQAEQEARENNRGLWKGC